MRLDDPASMEQWSLARIKRLAVQQQRLLLAGLRTLRPGGVLVYSTCTYAPEENESVLDRVLSKTGREYQVEPIPLVLPDVQPGLESWGGASFDRSVGDTIRILPGGDMAGKLC